MRCGWIDTLGSRNTVATRPEANRRGSQSNDDEQDGRFHTVSQHKMIRKPPRAYYPLGKQFSAVSSKRKLSGGDAAGSQIFLAKDQPEARILASIEP